MFFKSSLRACNFITKKLQPSCFLVEIAKFLRIPILKSICERLLLTFIITPIIFTFITFTTMRSSCLQMFYKISVLKNFANFTGKYLFRKFLRTSFLKEHLRWLLLYHCKLHLYRLRILLNSLLDCKYYPLSFSAKFCIFSSSMYFSLALFRAFPFLRPVKGFRIRLQPSDKL